MQLPRILEPEIMDTPQDARDYDSMDHTAVNRCFVADFLAVCANPSQVLDLGTGTAQIPLLLCEQASKCHITAIDAAQEMLNIAAKNVATAKFGSRIELVCSDAKALSYADNTFDAVISNSIVHHIPQPAAVLAEAVRVTRPGGLLFFRDLFRPPNVATLQQLVERYAGEANPHQKQLFSDSLHAALTVAEAQSLVVALGFPASTVQATSDRHWTWVACKSRS
jgi:ubiquinone/menaquinone biosynthesis C-methylase UbiE